MDTEKAYADRLQAQMRTADARLDELEAAARARNARAEMDEISGLRAQRDRVRQHVTDARKKMSDDWQAIRTEVDSEWTSFRRSMADAHNKYTAWDSAREQRFNAHLDQADAALKRSAAEDAEVAADANVQLAEARDELKAKAGAARRSYDAWRERRKDEKALQKLEDSELELDEAYTRYTLALDGVKTGARRPRAD
jgi:predicted neutral ceramidase superfamily lipid hydrolase